MTNTPEEVAVAKAMFEHEVKRMREEKCKQLNDFLHLNGIKSNLPDNMLMRDMINEALKKLGVNDETNKPNSKG